MATNAPDGHPFLNGTDQNSSNENEIYINPHVNLNSQKPRKTNTKSTVCCGLVLLERAMSLVLVFSILAFILTVIGLLLVLIRPYMGLAWAAALMAALALVGMLLLRGGIRSTP